MLETFHFAPASRFLFFRDPFFRCDFSADSFIYTILSASTRLPAFISNERLSDESFYWFLICLLDNNDNFHPKFNRRSRRAESIADNIQRSRLISHFSFEQSFCCKIDGNFLCLASLVFYHANVNVVTSILPMVYRLDEGCMISMPPSALPFSLIYNRAQPSQLSYEVS